ncbi:hypothetical protein N6L24_14560 [Cognatishimia sp. SS12]|uniref:hypothetical protein n=1 Tax=Cognatishimia sp. SS12 TaxID=2979465 RepID=UPI00232EFCE7|nr:hypothetical protein [Cognatishimia sp. SS12]MDC0739508.1 hypothetical protein [Cognatishimia sp. SS12]
MSFDRAALPWRVGILGDGADPAAQLIEEQPERSDHIFYLVSDPARDAEMVDELIVLSQGHALAHLPALQALNIPCQILLRRHGGHGSAADWAAGLDMLAAALARSAAPHLTLAALTPAATEALRPQFPALRAWPDLRPVYDDVPRFPVDRNEAQSTFSIEFNDLRESRRIERDALHWARLRCLAQLIARDPQDVDMQDLVALANGTRLPRPELRPEDRPLRWLAVVPNGVGLGHITRMMALATALKQHRKADVIFWCFSRAAEILQAAGFQIVLRQTAQHLKAHPPAWRDWESAEFARAIQHIKPDVVSYDGAVIDPFVFRGLRHPGCGRTAFVWVLRGMMRPDADPAFLENAQYCDLILEPGDFAVSVDRGATRTRQPYLRGFSSKITTQPVAFSRTQSKFSRREAKKRMQLGWGKHCLVSLGGAFGDWDAIEAEIIAEAKAHGVTLIWAQSPLAPPPRDSDTPVRRLFPLSRYLAGIDGVITATGYNSFHELMLEYTGPVMFAPTNHIRMDDQVARAQFAADQGWASIVLADQQSEMKGQIAAFMAEVQAGQTYETRPDQSLDGAEFARHISAICQRYAVVQPEWTT